MSDNLEPMQVSVWRTPTAKRPAGAFEQFDVPQRKSQTVLDVVSWIQENADPTLSYRYACRVGMCGSCAMMVNGEPRWTCRTHVNQVLDNGKLTVEPLRNLPVIKDLAADMDEFFDKWVKAEGVFHPSKTRDEAIERIDPTSSARVAASAGIECINCGVCYAACDAVAANPYYLGPAALNRAWTLVNDVRDGAGRVRIAAVSGAGGCHSCHAQQNCTKYCPNELNPTASIAGLKRASVMAVLKRSD